MIVYCDICDNSGWVCVKHPDKAFDLECSCSSGKPCICNEKAESRFVFTLESVESDNENEV